MEWIVLENSGKSARIERDGVRKTIQKPSKVTAREFFELFVPGTRLTMQR
jgi:hypothetical protein